MHETLTVARLSFLEVLRKRVLTAAALIGFGYLVLYAYGLSRVSDISLPQQVVQLQMFSMALFGSGFLVNLLAVMVASGSLAGEIEHGTAYAVLTRPLTKLQFLLGKFVGYGLLLVIFSTAFFLGLWLLTYWVGGTRLGGLLPSLGLFVLQPLVMLSLTVLGSSFLSTMAAGVVSFMMYGVSFVGGMIEQIGALVDNQSLVNLGILSSLLLPVDSLFRLSTFVLTNSLAEEGIAGSLQRMNPFGGLSVPSGWIVFYALGYVLLMLFLAFRIFQRRDI